MLKQGKKHSPSGKAERHGTSLRHKSAGTTFWWNEPKAKGGHVDSDGANERGSNVGQHTPTIGPRVA